MKDQVLSILLEVYPPHIARSKLEKQLNCKSHGVTIAKYINKYGFEEGRVHWIKWLEAKKKAGTLERYIERFGEQEGTLKYKEKNSKLSVGTNALKKNGFTEDQISEIKNTHKRKSARTLENYVQKYGEEGLPLHTEWKQNASERSHWSVEFWVKRGFSEEEARQYITDAQRRGYSFFEKKGWSVEQYENLVRRRISAIKDPLKYYRKIYGEKAEEMYHWDKAKGSDLNYLREKHGVEKGEEIYENMLKKKAFSGGSSSNIQLEFAIELFLRLPSYISDHFVGEPITENSFIINFPKGACQKCGLPDIRIKNILIEFDGDYWHSLPEIQERDIKKDEMYKQMGFKIYRVKERDFNSDLEATIQKCMHSIESNIELSFRHLQQRQEA